MSKFMKMLNNISRSQAIYRKRKIAASDLQSGHYAFVLAISRNEGASQEELASDLCLNKSTVARAITYLEENGYVTRAPQKNDRRQFSVYPTDKMRAVLPRVKEASDEWRRLLEEGIDEGEMAVFNSVLERMQAKAREITERQDEEK